LLIRKALLLASCLGIVATTQACGDSAPTTGPTPTGPKILCPAAPLPTVAVGPQGASVIFGAASVTGGALPVSTSCTPASGSTFPVGNTSVACTATDAQQRTDACSFSVVVQPPPVTPTIIFTRFVAFGDSITWGEDGDPLVLCGPNNNVVTGSPRVHPAQQVAQPYPMLLRQNLQARYATQTAQLLVDNQGAPGEDTSGSPPGATLARFQNVLAASSRLGFYQAVLLMEGTNDIFYGNDSAKIGAAVTNLGAMVDYAKSRNVRPFLATVPPMVPGGDRACGNREVVPLDDGIRMLAAQKGVTLVDVYAGLGASYQQYIGPDGLHPNAAGYAKIADTFFTTLKQTLEVPQATTNTFAAPTPVLPSSRARRQR
jgi:lysophospholipase L1-like esterase